MVNWVSDPKDQRVCRLCLKRQLTSNQWLYSEHLAVSEHTNYNLVTRKVNKQSLVTPIFNNHTKWAWFCRKVDEFNELHSKQPPSGTSEIQISLVATKPAQIPSKTTILSTWDGLIQSLSVTLSWNFRSNCWLNHLWMMDGYRFPCRVNLTAVN